MRLRRKSVDIVVAGDGEHARPEQDAADGPVEPTGSGVDPSAPPVSAPSESAQAVSEPAPTATQLPALEPIAAIPNGNGSHPNGLEANGSGTNGSGIAGERDAVGVPFGAAVVTFERPPAAPAPVAQPAPPAPLAPPAPVATATATGGGVATLAPPITAAPPAQPAPATTPALAAPLAPPAVPIASAAPAAPVAPTAEVAPVAYSAPPIPAPAPAAPLAPAPAATSTAVVVAPITWMAPGWREYRQRLTAQASAPAPAAAAPTATAPPAAPSAVALAPPPVALPRAVSAPLATPTAEPAAGGVSGPVDTNDAATPVDPPAAAALEVEPAAEAPPPGQPSHLGEMLLGRELVSREQLDQALAEQSASGMRIGSQLVAMGFVTERELVSVLAEQLEMRVADLRLVAPEPAAVALVPEELARRLEVVPVRMTPEGLEVARADALTGEERAEIESAIDGAIVPVLATPSEIQRAIDSTYQALAGMEQQVQAYADLAKSRAPVETGPQIVVDDRAPVVQVVTLLLTQAMRDRSSDIHIEPQEGDVRVRFRIDGVLREVTTIPQGMAQALISRIKVMADMNIVERRRSQDGQITTEIDGRPLDVRVATTATIWGEKAVLRLLDKTRSLRALSDLGMSRDVARAFSDLIVSPFGMVICVGPTGSGKTTTLYAALNEINSPERNITTIEDPVEYVLPRINQIQVNRQAGITFADGLKAIMRQDPDVILVGEIRDVETARIAVQSALTGHFVLSSLHATDCATALQRFRDMGIEPFLINSSVLALEAQRLVRRICVHCRESYEPTAAERAFFLQATGMEKESWTHGAGCNLCSHTGYSERIGVYELMRITDKIQDLVLADAGHDEIQAVAIEGGMRTLKDEAVRLVAEDTTTVAEAFRSVYTK